MAIREPDNRRKRNILENREGISSKNVDIPKHKIATGSLEGKVYRWSEEIKAYVFADTEERLEKNIALRKQVYEKRLRVRRFGMLPD